MIPNHTDRHVQTTGVSATKEMGISTSHSAHIMRILRSQLYSDKLMAVLREYSANAWDANREVGKDDVPIKVVLPTTLDPTLYIRDYGPGISHEDVFEIYAMYGESTKRNKNGQVGMLGIGSKSGFAYTDSFTVTTWQNGTQRIYAALLNNDEKGSFNLLDESPSDEETGTMVQIPVRTNDIPAFAQKAEKLFFHFKPRPNINITIAPEPSPEVVMSHGTMSRGTGKWYAVMGCIAYEVSLGQLRGLNSHRGGAGDFLDRLDGLLYFNIGEVEIAASREGLEYSDKTKAVLIDKFLDLVDEFVTHTLDKIELGDFSFWEKRCRAQVLNDLRLPVPGILKTMTDERIDMGDPVNFTFTYGPKQSQISHIHVDRQTRIIIRDEVKKIDGYSLSGFDYVVRPNVNVVPIPTMEEVRTELDELLEKLKIKGVPVLDISSIAWHSKAKFQAAAGRPTNRKHQVRTFVLKPDVKYYNNPWSDNWDIDARIPMNEDVYVVLRGFKVVSADPDDHSMDIGFYRHYTQDRSILQNLKLPVPPVYGYKTTEKEPVDTVRTPGTQYENWRFKHFAKVAKEPKVLRVFEAMAWVELVTRTHRRYSYREDNSVPHKVMSKLFKELGPDHALCAMFRKIMIAKRLLKRTPETFLSAVRGLRNLLEEEDKKEFQEEATTYKEMLDSAYPMFKTSDDGFKVVLGNDHEDLWIEYIKLVDRAKKGLNDEQSTGAHSNGRSDHDRVEGEGPHSEEGNSALPQPEERACESEGERRLEPDRGSLDGAGNGEGMVERQVRTDRGFGDLLRAASA